MIKRMKWNVLYGGGDGVDSDGGLTSSSEEEEEEEEDMMERQAKANAILQQLVERDPEMAETLHDKLEALVESSAEEDEQGSRTVKNVLADSSDDEEHESDGEEANSLLQNGKSVDADKVVADVVDPDQKYAEWRECELCAGKRMLNDADVEAHLSSKKHLRAVAKFEKRGSKKEEDQDENKSEQVSTGNSQDKETIKSKKGATLSDIAPTQHSLQEKSEEQIRTEKQRKEKTKRKLKLLKQRNWKKMHEEKMKEKKDEEGRSEENVAGGKQKNDEGTTRVGKEMEEKVPTLVGKMEKRKNRKKGGKGGKLKSKEGSGADGGDYNKDTDMATSGSDAMTGGRRDDKGACNEPHKQSLAVNRSRNKLEKRGRDESPCSPLAKKKKKKKNSKLSKVKMG